MSLNELASLDDIAEEGFSYDEPTLTLEEVLYNLVREPEEIPTNELAAFLRPVACRCRGDTPRLGTNPAAAPARSGLQRD